MRNSTRGPPTWIRWPLPLSWTGVPKGTRELVLGASAYLAACSGMKPPKGVWCHVVGTDLVRHSDGRYYVLAVAPSLRGRLTGVTPAPAEPRLIVGEGGRDGESMPLEKLVGYAGMTGVGVGVLLLLISKPVTRLMGGVK